MPCAWASYCIFGYGYGILLFLTVINPHILALAYGKGDIRENCEKLTWYGKGGGGVPMEIL